MVPACDSFTDIGTDHGYLPVYLVHSCRCKRAVASDIRRGPLKTAEDNANRYGIPKDQMELVLSDGLRNINVPDHGFNVLSVMGMGGLNIAGILEDGGEKVSAYDVFLFSPHTKQEEFRRYLLSHGYLIKDEKYVVDEDKLYVIIKAVHNTGGSTSEAEDGVYLRFGGFIEEALCDGGVRSYFIRQYETLCRIIRDSKYLPEDRLMKLSDEIGKYREVLKIEA